MPFSAGPTTHYIHIGFVVHLKIFAGKFMTNTVYSLYFQLNCFMTPQKV